MTVCLVIPPSPFLLDERVFMSLGVLRVAAVLERAGIPVKVWDLSGCDLEDLYEAPVADVYGLTVTTPQLPSAVAISHWLRDYHPSAKIIMGGPHVTLTHAAKGPRGRAGLAQLFTFADVLVAGDGERAIFDALKAPKGTLVDGDNPKLCLFLKSSDLDELPYPARHLIDVDSYHYEIDGQRALSLVAQLGCPFGCGFCGGRASPSLRRIRTRTTANIVAEVAALYASYGITGFMFYDDELNVNPKLVELMDTLAVLQSSLGVSFALRGFIKAELFTDAQAAAMARAGFKWILVGFESGSPRILENIQKRATREENTRCLEIAHRHGLKVKALMSLGHPGESPETIQQTQDWLTDVRPDDFDVTTITLFPGTPYYDEATQIAPGVWSYRARSGDRLHSEDVDFATTADFYKGVPGGYTSHVWTDALTRQDLTEARDTLEADLRSRWHLAYPQPSFEHSMGQTAL